jgi:hypothetical protein
MKPALSCLVLHCRVLITKGLRNQWIFDSIYMCISFWLLVKASNLLLLQCLEPICFGMGFASLWLLV